jgi:hypothetical protein
VSAPTPEQRTEWRRLATESYQPRGNRAVWAQRCAALIDALDATEARLAAEREHMPAVLDRWEGYGHGHYNIHLEEALPCSVCDLLADLRAARIAREVPDDH